MTAAKGDRTQAPEHPVPKEFDFNPQALSPDDDLRLKIEIVEEWIAPYVPYNEGRPHYPDTYTAWFFPEHTMELHDKHMGRKSGSGGTTVCYSARMTVEQREMARRDPGVKKVVKNGAVEWG